MLPSPATTFWSDSAAFRLVFLPAQAAPASRRRTRCRAAPARAPASAAPRRARRARHQLHEAEAARIVERDDRAVRHVKHHMIVRRELAALVVDSRRASFSSLPCSTRNEPDMPRCISSTSPEDRSASRYLARRPRPLDGLALEPLGEILRQRPAQVRPRRASTLHEARALHHGLQAAAHGLDFGKLGHRLTLA